MKRIKAKDVEEVAELRQEIKKLTKREQTLTKAIKSLLKDGAESPFCPYLVKLNIPQMLVLDWEDMCRRILRRYVYNGNNRLAIQRLAKIKAKAPKTPGAAKLIIEANPEWIKLHKDAGKAA